MTVPGDTFSAELAADHATSLAAIAEVADGWGADWRPEVGSDGSGSDGSGSDSGGSDDGGSDGSEANGGGSGGAEITAGRLVLPRVAGLHRGILVGRVQLYAGSADAAATRAVFEVEAVQDHVHVAAVVILVLAAFGALLTVIWPFYPALMPVAPFGILLAFGGWFLVLSRLQNSGPEEFFHLVEETLTERSAGDATPTAEPGAESDAASATASATESATTEPNTTEPTPP